MINLAIKQSGPNSNTVFPNQIEVDYVRVYQENPTDIIHHYDDRSRIYPNPTINNLILEGENLQQLKYSI